MAELLTIGEVAARSGVATSALRFYEERGLIRSERAGSGHRRFNRPVIRRVAFIVFAQRVGLSLEEIGEELSKLPADRVPTRQDWAKLSTAWSSRSDERIPELGRLKEGLTECIGCGCLSLGRCHLANPGDRIAARGPGPPYWIGAPAPGARATGSATRGRRNPLKSSTQAPIAGRDADFRVTLVAWRPSGDARAS